MRDIQSKISEVREFLLKEKSFFRLIAVFLTGISCSLLIIVPDSSVCSAFNILVSLALLLFPESYVPLIISSSVSQSVSIFGFSAAFYYLLILSVYVSIVSNFKFDLKEGKSRWFLLLFVLWIFVGAGTSLAGTLSVAFKLLLMILLCFLCASTRALNIKDTLYFLTASTPIILIAVLAKLLFAPTSYVIEGHYTLTTGISVAPQINPNQIAQYISVLFFLSFASISEKRKVLPLACLFLAGVSLYLLKSRTSFYAALGISALYFLFVSKSKPVFKIGLSIGAALFIAFKLLTTTSDPSDATAQGDEKDMNVSAVVASGGSGRFFTWAEVVTDVFPNHPVRGIGVGVENYEALGMDFDSDNLFMDLLAETGIVGFILFFIFFILLIKDISHKEKNKGKPVKYLVCMFLFFGIGETVFDSFFLWSIIFVGYLYIFSRKQISFNG